MAKKSTSRKTSAKKSAKKSMRKKRRPSRTTLIEQSLRDAQRVLTGYIESGGKQVTDTIGALMNIFESPKLGRALQPSRRSARRGPVAKRPSAKRKTAGAAARRTQKDGRRTRS
jgi:hypothetical protein